MGKCSRSGFLETSCGLHGFAQSLRGPKTNPLVWSKTQRDCVGKAGFSAATRSQEPGFPTQSLTPTLSPRGEGDGFSMRPDRSSGRRPARSGHRSVFSPTCGKLTCPREVDRHSPTGSGSGRYVLTQRYRNQTPINRRHPPHLPSYCQPTPTRPCPCRQTCHLAKRGADRVAENDKRHRARQSSADLRLEVPRLVPADRPRGEHQQRQPCQPSLQPIRDKLVSRTPSRSLPAELRARPCIGPSSLP
jgi:hypothetical protein